MSPFERRFLQELEAAEAVVKFIQDNPEVNHLVGIWTLPGSLALRRSLDRDKVFMVSTNLAPGDVDGHKVSLQTAIHMLNDCPDRGIVVLMRIPFIMPGGFAINARCAVSSPCKLSDEVILQFKGRVRPNGPTASFFPNQQSEI